MALELDMALGLDMTLDRGKHNLCTSYDYSRCMSGKSTDNCTDSCKVFDIASSTDSIDKCTHMDSYNTGKGTGIYSYTGLDMGIRSLDHMPKRLLQP
jgi:hypothetical protein